MKGSIFSLIKKNTPLLNYFMVWHYFKSLFHRSVSPIIWWVRWSNRRNHFHTGKLNMTHGKPNQVECNLMYRRLVLIHLSSRKQDKSGVLTFEEGFCLDIKCHTVYQNMLISSVLMHYLEWICLNLMCRATNQV